MREAFEWFLGIIDKALGRGDGDFNNRRDYVLDRRDRRLRSRRRLERREYIPQPQCSNCGKIQSFRRHREPLPIFCTDEACKESEQRFRRNPKRWHAENKTNRRARQSERIELTGLGAVGERIELRVVVDFVKGPYRTRYGESWMVIGSDYDSGLNVKWFQYSEPDFGRRDRVRARGIVNNYEEFEREIVTVLKRVSVR